MFSNCKATIRLDTRFEVKICSVLLTAVAKRTRWTTFRMVRTLNRADLWLAIWAHWPKIDVRKVYGSCMECSNN